MLESLSVGDVVTIIVALFGSGVVGVIIKTFMERRKLTAEATNTDIKSLLEIDQRMNERMAKLEERVANLEQENYKLKSEKLTLEKEANELKIKLIKLEEENRELVEENNELKNKLTELNTIT